MMGRENTEATPSHPTQSFRLGLVGFGEVGYHVAKGLRDAGLTRIVAFDETARRGTLAHLLTQRAENAGVRVVEECSELAAESDVVLSVTPGSSCSAAADAIAPYLGSGHIYVDLASATPAVKLSALARVTPTGATVADGSIMGSPVLDAHRVEIIASGPGAEAFRETLVPWGMNIESVGQRLGTASGIKIYRSVIAKGLEALLIECLMGAEELGISEQVLQSYTRFLAPRSFADTANFLVTTNVIHAARRADEAAMSVAALREVGIDPTMTEATVARLRSVASLGLKEALGGQTPERYPEAIAAIMNRLGSGAERHERPPREAKPDATD